MYGKNFGGREHPDLLGHQGCSPNMYIFVTYDDKYYKMTAVSLADARGSSKPPTPVDKNIRAKEGSIDIDNGLTVCKMWNGMYDGCETKTHDD